MQEGNVKKMEEKQKHFCDKTQECDLLCISVEKIEFRDKKYCLGHAFVTYPRK